MKKILLSTLFLLATTPVMAEKNIIIKREVADSFSVQQVQHLSHERIGSIEKVSDPQHNLLLYRGLFNVKIKKENEQSVYEVPVTFSVWPASKTYSFYNIEWKDSSNAKIMKLLNEIDAKEIDALDFEEKMRPYLEHSLPNTL